MSSLLIALMLLGVGSATALIFAFSGLSSPYTRRESAVLKQKLQSFGRLQGQETDIGPTIISEKQRGIFLRLSSNFAFYQSLQKLIRWSARVTTPESVIKLVIGISLSVGLLTAILTRSFVLSLMAAALAGVIPIANLRIRAEQRRKLFEMQFPDALEFHGACAKIRAWSADGISNSC